MKNIKLDAKTTSKRDIALWTMIGVAFLAALIVNYYFFSTQTVAIRLIAWIILGLVLSLLFFYTTQGQIFAHFVQASRVELWKVVWPTREETIRTAFIVMVMVFVSGLLLWVIDTLLLWLVSFLTGANQR